MLNWTIWLRSLGERRHFCPASLGTLHSYTTKTQNNKMVVFFLPPKEIPLSRCFCSVVFPFSSSVKIPFFSKIHWSYNIQFNLYVLIVFIADLYSYSTIIHYFTFLYLWTLGQNELLKRYIPLFLDGLLCRYVKYIKIQFHSGFFLF